MTDALVIGFLLGVGLLSAVALFAGVGLVGWYALQRVVDRRIVRAARRIETEGAIAEAERLVAERPR